MPVLTTMHVSDLKAYSDNARPFWGQRTAEPPRNKAARDERSRPPEKTAAESASDILSDGPYKGNFIDIYV